MTTPSLSPSPATNVSSMDGPRDWLLSVPRRLHGRGLTLGALLLMTAALIAGLTVFGGGTVQADSVPGEVINLRLSSDALGELTITWDAPSDAPADYRVVWARDDLSYLSWDASDETHRGSSYPDGADTSLTLSGLTGGETYKVRMRSRYSPGTSDGWSGPWSDTEIQRVRSDPPQAPGALGVGVVDHDGVSLSWSAPTHDVLTGYRVLRGAGAASLDTLAELGVDARSYTDTATDGATTYHYVIVALSQDGDSPRSSAVTATTPPRTPVTPVIAGAPAAPTGLTGALDGNGGVTLSWTDPYDSAITGYRVLRGADARSLVVIAEDTGSAAVSYTDAAPAANATHVYAVQARNAAGLSQISATFSATTLNPPFGLGADAGAFDVALSWRTPDGDGITGYQVRRGDSADEMTVIADDTGNTDTSYTDAPVTPETTYYYAVRARSAQGLSPGSPAHMVTTPALSQSTGSVMVSNLGQPSSARYTVISPNHHYAQSFCTGSVATTLDKVRLYTISKSTDPNAQFYGDPAPVVTIRSTDAWGKPGAVLHTLTNPVIDGSKDTAEDFTSSGFELAANTTYSVAIYRPSDSGHFAFVDTESTLEETEPQLGWTIGDQYMYLWDAGEGWTDTDRQGYIMKMAVYASGGLPSVSTPAFTDCGDNISSYQFSVDENSAENTVVGVAAAGDADGDSLTYSVSGTGAAEFNNVFDFDTATGEITVKAGANIDYESSVKSYSVTVSVTDGEDASGAAESPPTIDATTSVSIEVINIDDPGTITFSTTAPRVGSMLTASISDQDGTPMLTNAQWSRAPRADALFIDIDGANHHSAHRDESDYTPTAADQGKYLRVTLSYVEDTCHEVSSFDDRCRRKATKTLTTLVANEEGLIVQSQQVNNNNPATGTVLITGTPRLGWTLETHGRRIADAEGRRGALYFQWIRLDPVTEVEQNVSNPEAPGVWWSYVVQEADVGKDIKVRVSFTDNAGNAESVTSDAVAGPYPLTATTHDAPGSHDGSAAFSFELWFSEAPAVGFATVRDHAFTVTGGSVDNVRRLAPGNNARWEITVTPDSEADVTLALNSTTTKCSAEGAICNVDGVKLSGVLELVVPGPSSNSAATGAPTISGTARVGESLTASTSDIADADGLANASFTYQWLADDLDISGATGSSYTVVTADAGKVIKVTVSFTDDAGNEESVTSAATATVTQSPLTASTHDVPESHDGATAFTFELRFSEEPGGGFSATTLRDQALTVSGGTITNVHQLEPGKKLKWEITLQPSGNEEVTVILLPTIDCADQDAICTGDGRGLSVGQAILVQGPQNSAATGAPTINGTAQVGETLTASTSGISDADGLTNASFTYQWLADDTDISSATSSSYTLVAADQGKVIKVTVSFTDDAGNAETLTSAATTAVALAGGTSNSLERSDQEAVEENSAATGAPTISGTAQGGEILTASTSDIADADGLTNASFTYQWLADDTAISGATGSSYTVAAGDAGKAITVTVSFTDDDGNAETLTSAATAAVTQPPMTAAFHDGPSSHDGSAAFTFELRFSEDIEGLSYTTLQDHAFTVTGGSLSNVRRQEPGKNARWEITVQPDSDADVTTALNTTTDCSAEGAICTSDGRMLSGGLELVVPGPPSNSAATGVPTIGGTAQVGETLAASTSGISDADGLANATFTYQWMSDDTEISGATGSSHTLAEADAGKAIKVRVSFTDDAGNAENLTSEATTAVARPPLTATIHDKPSSHDGNGAFTFELRFSENIAGLSYTTLQEHALTVTGGTLPKVGRLEPGKNVRWEITVQPSSDAGVTIVLPITTDCAAQGAICTSDSRKLSSRVEVTVSGPGG